LTDLGIGGRITLRWLLEKRNVRMWIGFNSLRIGTSGGLSWAD